MKIVASAETTAFEIRTRITSTADEMVVLLAPRADGPSLMAARRAFEARPGGDVALWHLDYVLDESEETGPASGAELRQLVLDVCKQYRDRIVKTTAWSRDAKKQARKDADAWLAQRLCGITHLALAHNGGSSAAFHAAVARAALGKSQSSGR